SRAHRPGRLRRSFVPWTPTNSGITPSLRKTRDSRSWPLPKGFSTVTLALSMACSHRATRGSQKPRTATSEFQYLVFATDDVLAHESPRQSRIAATDRLQYCPVLADRHFAVVSWIDGLCCGKHDALHLRAH